MIRSHLGVKLVSLDVLSQSNLMMNYRVALFLLRASYNVTFSSHEQWSMVVLKISYMIVLSGLELPASVLMN